MKENDPKMNTRCGKLLTSIHLARHVADCRTCNGLLINNPDTQANESCICPEGSRKEDGVCVEDTKCPALFYGANCENFCQVDNCETNCGDEGCLNCLTPFKSTLTAGILTCEDCQDGYYYDTTAGYTPSCIQCHCSRCRGSPNDCYYFIEGELNDNTTQSCYDGYKFVEGSVDDSMASEGILMYRCAADIYCGLVTDNNNTMTANVSHVIPLAQHVQNPQ